MQMTNKHMQRRLISLVTRELQIKTIMKYNFTPIEVVKLAKQTTNPLTRPSFGKDVRQLELYYIAGRMQNGTIWKTISV